MNNLIKSSLQYENNSQQLLLLECVEKDVQLAKCIKKR